MHVDSKCSSLYCANRRQKKRKSVTFLFENTLKCSGLNDHKQVPIHPQPKNDTLHEKLCGYLSVITADTHTVCAGQALLCRFLVSVSFTHRLTVEFIDLGQVGENAGQLIRAQHRPHLLEKDLVQDPQGPQMGRLGGEQL